MRDRIVLKLVRIALLLALLPATILSVPAIARAQDSKTEKAQSLVDAAIKMTDSAAAVKLLWQATEIDPSYDASYVYLGLYYNSRSDFSNVIKVYQKLVKYEPKQVSAYLNIGEAYMSFTPPKTQEALVYYKKAYEMDSGNSFAALRIGQLLAENGSREEAMKYLKIALADTKNPAASSEAEKVLHQMGAL